MISMINNIIFSTILLGFYFLPTAVHSHSSNQHCDHQGDVGKIICYTDLDLESNTIDNTHKCGSLHYYKCLGYKKRSALLSVSDYEICLEGRLVERSDNCKYNDKIDDDDDNDLTMTSPTPVYVFEGDDDDDDDNDDDDDDDDDDDGDLTIISPTPEY
eukprot:Pgem_evm1s17813